MRSLMPAVVLICAVSLFAQDATTTKKEPPVLGPHWAKDAVRPIPPPASADMVYHGGPILPSVTIKAIWWGSSWPSYTGDEITGIDKWYSNVGTVAGGAGSSYDATVNEYTDSSGHQVSTATTYQGHVVDGSALPRRNSTSTVLSE